MVEINTTSVSTAFRPLFLGAIAAGMVPYVTMLVVHTLIVVFVPSLIIEGAILVIITSFAYTRMYETYPQIFRRNIKSSTVLGFLYWLPIGISLLLSLIIGKPLGLTPIGNLSTLLGMVVSLVVASLIFQSVMKVERFPKWYLLATLIPSLWFGGSVLTFGIRSITVTIAISMLFAFLLATYVFILFPVTNNTENSNPV